MTEWSNKDTIMMKTCLFC